jgi:hypothetical protein
VSPSAKRKHLFSSDLINNGLPVPVPSSFTPLFFKDPIGPVVGQVDRAYYWLKIKGSGMRKVVVYLQNVQSLATNSQSIDVYVGLEVDAFPPSTVPPLTIQYQENPGGGWAYTADLPDGDGGQRVGFLITPR